MRAFPPSRSGAPDSRKRIVGLSKVSPNDVDVERGEDQFLWLQIEKEAHVCAEPCPAHGVGGQALAPGGTGGGVKGRGARRIGSGRRRVRARDMAVFNVALAIEMRAEADGIGLTIQLHPRGPQTSGTLTYLYLPKKK